MYNFFPVNLDIDDFYYLRKIEETDLENFYNYYTDPEVHKDILSYMPTSLEDMKSELDYWMNLHVRGHGVYWAIARKDNNELIGTMGFDDFDRYNRRAEINYDISKDYWRKGIVSRGVKVLLKYGFEELNLIRIYAITLDNNIASNKLLEKCGFQKEGILRKYRYFEGKFYDVLMYSYIGEN